MTVGTTIRVWLICLGSILSLFIIQEGLLIKKHITEEKSQCSDVHAGKYCWIEPSYKKAIIVLVDALRFDFVNPDIQDEKFYHGSMPNIGRCLKNHKDNCRLFKFMADPPTTTSQRVTALVTGSAPAFIDASGNFDATETKEDNLISQFKSLNRTTVLLGDDTWISLLPNEFTRNFAMDSFDVKDLDLVDTTIRPKLFEELEHNNFSLLISHFLGVDHCGHRYGPNHPEMRRKLNEMDNVVMEVIEKHLDDDTILFVFGDHGMTESGDHGGEGQLEIEAALFVYSKRPLPKESSQNYLTISQIDILPTISLLLDLPIPFSNLGAVIESLFEDSKLQMARKLNVMQIMRYISSYKIQNPIIQKSIKHAIQSYESQVETNSSLSDHEIMQELKRLIFKTINNFNMNLIYIGLACFGECLLTLCVCLIIGKGMSLFVFIIFRSGLLLLQYAIYVGGGVMQDNNLIYLAVYLSIAYNVVVISMTLSDLKWRSLFQFRPIVLPFLLSIGLFSNSFIIYGGMTGRFLLTSIVCILGFQFLRKKWLLERPRYSEKRLNFGQFKKQDLINLIAFVTLFVILRLSVYFNRCREEQIECFESFFAIPTGLIVERDLRLQRLIIGIVCSAICFKFFQHSTKGSINIHFSFAWLAILAVYFNWTCESLAVDSFRQAGIYSAQLVYAICLIILLVTIFVASNFYEFIQTLRIVLFLLLLLLLGDGMSISFAFVTVANIIWQKYGDNFDAFGNAEFYFLLNNHLFYAFGHHATFTSIPWNAAFVGIPNMTNKIIPAALVIIHIYSGTLFCSLESAIFRPNLKVLYIFHGFEGIKTLMICVVGLIQRRHLMFYKIFAPNFLFQAINFVLLSTIVILVQTLFLIKRK